MAMLLLGADSGFVDASNLAEHWQVLERGGCVTADTFVRGMAPLRRQLIAQDMPTGDVAEYEDLHDELRGGEASGAAGEGGGEVRGAGRAEGQWEGGIESAIGGGSVLTWP